MTLQEQRYEAVYRLAYGEPYTLWVTREEAEELDVEPMMDRPGLRYSSDSTPEVPEFVRTWPEGRLRQWGERPRRNP